MATKARIPITLSKTSIRCYNTAKSLDNFKAICSQQPSETEYPLAHSIDFRIPIYTTTSFSTTDNQTIQRLQSELKHLLHHGPGVYILKHLYPRASLLPRVNAIFSRIIAREATTSKGDHFSASGNNTRIWNSFGKHCLQDPVSFAEYYANPWLRIVSESWLGPAYRITAQCNIVKPGGKPQLPHRDYHLGFQTAEAVAKYPLATQVASQFLTLQGAVAHSDMPLESGPTRFLPYSQTYAEGYSAYRDPAFQEYFQDSWVSLPLEEGDGVFFNPALFHAAGKNKSEDIERSANLLQVSSAFGKTMESLDSVKLVERCWEEMRGMYEKQGMSQEVEALIRAVGDGYPFPTNLDTRPPSTGGMAPEDEQSIMRGMLVAGTSTEEVVAALTQMREDAAM